MLADGTFAYIWVDVEKKNWRHRVHNGAATPSHESNNSGLSEINTVAPKSPGDPIKRPTRQGVDGTLSAGVRPTFRQELTGENEVRVRNPNAQRVAVGIRRGDVGKDFEVPARRRVNAYA